MKELRTQVDTYSKKELQTLISEMYKAVPKQVKEEKQLDELIKDPEYFKKNRKTPGSQAEVPDMGILANDIHTFIDHANKDYYFAPNRVVPKKERSKWRFKAKRFYKDLIAAFQAPENQKEAAECMENLYKLFCKGTGYYMFVNPEPFEALNIPQEAFFEQTLRMKKDVEDPQVWVKNGLRLALDNKDDYHVYNTELIETFVNLLQTPPLTEMAITEAKQMKLRKEQQKTKSKKGHFTDELHECEEHINNIVEAVFLCYAKLHEWDEAITYWKKNHLESKKEAKLVGLLRFLEEYNQIDKWKKEYNQAVRSGIQPRNIIQKTYHFLDAQGTFPSYEDIYEMKFHGPKNR